MDEDQAKQMIDTAYSPTIIVCGEATTLAELQTWLIESKKRSAGDHPHQ